MNEGHREDRRPNHNSRLSGKEWLEDHTGEKSRIIERRGISRRLIFAATSELENWRESKQRESFEWKTGRLVGLCCLRRLRAHPSCSLILQLGQNKVRAKPGTHASELSGVWVQEVPQATRPDWVDSQGNRLEKLPLTAWGEERFKANRATHGSNPVASMTSTEPIVKCLPPGVPAIYMVSIYPNGDHSGSRPSDYVFRIRQLCTTNSYGWAKASESDSDVDGRLDWQVGGRYAHGRRKRF